MNKFLKKCNHPLLYFIGGVLCLLVKYLNLIPKAIGDYIIGIILCCLGSYIIDIIAMTSLVLALGSYIYTWQRDHALRFEIRKTDLAQISYEDMRQEIRSLKEELEYVKDKQYNTMIKNQDKILELLKGNNNV